MPIFDLNGKKYDVEDKYLDAFSKQNPDAYTIEEREGKRYKVRAKDYGNFRTHFDKPQQEAVQQSEDDAVFEANAERFRNGQPIERVTTQSVIDANPELGLQTNAVQPENPRWNVPQYDWRTDQQKKIDELNNSTTATPVKDQYGNEYYPVKPREVAYDEAVKGLKDISERKAETKSRLQTISNDVSNELNRLQSQVEVSNLDKFRPANLQSMPVNPVNQELMPEYTALRKAQRLVEESNNIIEEASKKGNTNFMAGLARGFWDNLNAEDYTFGADDAAQSAFLYRALDKAEKGEALTKAEETLLDAAAINMAVQSYYAQDLGKGYGAGQVTAESIPFMLEMAINPISASGKTTAKALLNYGLKKFAKNKAAKVGARLAGDALAATGMAATTGFGDVLEGTTDRLAQNYNYQLDDEGRLHVEKKDDTMGMGEAFARSFATRAIENQSEMIFKAFEPIGGFMKGVQDILPGGVNKFFEMLGNNKVADAYRAIKNSPVFRNYLVKDIRNATQIGGLGEEYLEEVYNNIANAAIGEMKWEDVVSLDKNIDTLLGLAPTQVMFGLLGLGGAGAMRYQTRKTLEDLQATMNEQQRKDLEGLLDMGLDAKEVDVRGFIRNVMQNESYTIENKRDLIKAAYNVAKQNGIDELTEADTIDKVNAENALIDSVTDPSTGIYTEITATLPDANEGTIEVPGYVVGWLGEGEKRQPIFVQEGMDNTYENRRVLKPGQWSEEAVQQMPAEEVKAINEEMIREEAAHQAEQEAKYAPEVLNAQMQQGVPFNTPNSQIIPVAPMPEGNGWIVEEYALDTNNKVAKTPIVRELTNDEYRDMLQAQLNAEEAAQEQIAAEEQAASPEVVEEAQPTEEADIKENLTTESGNNLSPVEEVAQPQAEVKPQTPVIPTNEDGSIDFVSYGKEGTFKTLGEKYGEKMPNKVAVTAKAFADDLVKAQKKLDKAIEEYDNAPIGREEKAEKARNKAQEEFDVIKRQADFWAALDKEIKDAQVKPGDEVAEEILSMEEPLNGEEFAAQMLANGNIKLLQDSFASETGFGKEETKKYFGLFASSEKGGMTIQQAGERLMEADRENGTNFFDQLDSNSGRDALINVLGSVKSRKELNQYIATNRAEQAKRESEGLRNELEKQAMEANYASLEDYVLQMEAAEMENPFLNDRADEIMAIFAEEAAKYEQSLNNTENGQGTENEVVEGNDSILPEEQLDNTGRTEVSEESERIGDGTSEESESTHAATEVELKQEEGETTLQFAERAAEENRRRPLRKRAEEWSNTLGIKVTYLESIDDVDAKTRAEIEAAHAKGKSVPGWVNKKGEVFFFMPDLTDLKDVDDTYIHEVVAHVGLPQLLGKERFGELCDKVWEMMPQSAKDYYMSYPGVKNHRDAADEYIAHLAEQQNLTPEEKTIWDNIVKMFREMLDKALNGIISKSKLTDEDISNLIKASYANLKSGAEGVSGEGTRFSVIERANEEFNKQLDEFKNKTHRGLLSLGAPQDILRKIGVNVNEITISPTILHRHLKKHHLDIEDLKGLASAIQNPILSYKHGKRFPNLVIVTEINVKGGKLSVSLELDESGSVVEINNVKSVHSKEALTELQRLSEFSEEEFKSSLKWVEKEKVSEWLLRLPYEDERTIDNQKLNSIANIINSFENPKTIEEKSPSFRVIEDKNGRKSLVGLHNISEEKLRKAIKQGGLANPSMAVIDMDKQSHVDYGDITLIAPSSLIDKKTGKNIGTYTADAWTPIYPNIEKRMSDKGAKAYSESLESVPSELRNKVRLYFNAYLEDGNTSGALNYWFLNDTGKNPPSLTSQSNDYTNEELDAIEAISNAGYYSGLNEEEKQKVLDLFIEKQGGKDAFDARIAERIETMKNNLQRPDLKAFIKNKVEQKLQEIQEYGYDYEQVSNFYSNAQRAINNRGKIDEFRTFRNAQDIVNNEGLQGEFNEWLADKEEQFGVEEYLFVGYNNNGDRKYLPNTLENASKLMKKEGRAGATGLHGFNHFVATLAPNAGTLAQINKKKGNLSTQEEYKEFVYKWGPVYHDLAEVLRGVYDGYSDVGYYRLEEMPTVKNPKEYVMKEYGIELSDEFMKKYNEFVSAIKNDFPARYFETKFERPVYLNEFVAAVVPSDMGLDLYGQLQRMGIPMYEYERGNNEARMEAVDKVTIDNEGVRFRFIGERGARNLDKAEEATTRLDNLNVAREMEAAEKDAKTIKMATGWERGADGLWRYETMDSETAIKDGDEADIRRQIEAIEEEEKAYKKKAREEGIGPDEREEAYINFYRRRGFLEAQLAYVMAKNADVMTHISTSLHHVLDKTDSDSLFKAYPELEFVKVGFATELVGKSLGATVINGTRIEAINLDVKRSTPEELNGYLAHEIQHAIQEIEGFAPGGDPSMESPRKAEQKAKNISFMKDKLDKSISERNSLLKQRNEINDKMSAWWDAHEDATRDDMLADKVMQQYNREYDELSKQIDEADNTVKFNEKWLDATLQANTALGYEGYKKLAGEVEARNVTSRLGMTLEQRRSSLASETEDVAREDQIFLKDGIESGMRFRLSEKGKQIKSEVDKFTSKYNSKPVELIDPGMTDEEIEDAIDWQQAAKDLKDYIKESKSMGGYVGELDKILIFVENMKLERMEEAMFHENLHPFVDGGEYDHLLNKLYENGKDDKALPRARRFSDREPKAKRPLEFFNYAVSYGQVNGNLDDVLKYFDKEEQAELLNLLKENGYDYYQEQERRRGNAVLDGLPRREENDERVLQHQEGGQENNGRVSSESQEEKLSPAERKSRLNELFNKVADMGFQGVLGNKEYTSLMVDIYKALPEEVRAEIAEDAIRLYGGSVAPAVSDYIGPKSKNSIMDKVVTIVREALRKIGFDLDLKANEVRYMAWRSKKPLDRNNMFEVAEDIDMKYRLKVGEYDGTTPDGGGTRFSVKSKPKTKAELKEEVRDLKEDVRGLKDEVRDLKKQVNTLRSGNKDEWEKKQRAIVSFIKGRLTKEAGSVLGKTRLDQLLTLVNKASTATDLHKPLQFIEQVINDASIEYAAANMDKLIKTKLQGETNRGVAKGVVVDESTRRLFDSIRGTFKELIATSIDSELRSVRGEILRFGKEINALPKDDIQGRAILTARQDALKERRKELEEEQEELQRQNITETKEILQRRHNELIEAMDAHIEGEGVWTQEMQDEYDSIPLRLKLAEIRESQSQLDAILADAIMTRRNAYKNNGKSRKKMLAEADVIESNYTIAQEELIKLMNEVSDELNAIIKEGKSRLATRKQALAERRRAIVTMGISAVKDKEIKDPNAILTKKEKFDKWFDNSWLKSVSDFMTAPLNSFNFMLKYIDRNHTIGEGDLYKHFMKSEEGALEANNRLYDGLKAYNTAIEEKAKEIFGKDIEAVMKDSGKEHIGEVHKQYMYDSRSHKEGDMFPISITKGQAFYVWLTWRQDDGRAKLVADGWNDQSIEEIEALIGEDYIKFGEWITDEFFPMLREEKYNKTHIDMFGTSMAKREHYFPFKVQSEDIQEKGEMGESYSGMPSTITGNIIKRTINKSRIKTDQNAFDLLFKYGNDMETWNAMAKLRQDLNFLYSSKAFRNYLEANSKGLFDKFMKAAEVAVKAYNNGEKDAINDFFAKLNRTWAGTNIGFRLNTAMKQILSYPAFMAYSGNLKYQGYLMKYMLNWVGNYKWAKENLPAFRNRVESGDMGMTGMTDPSFDLGKVINKFGEWGMIPNQLVDALTCAAGARSVYDFEYNRAIKAGMSEEEAKNIAQYNAEVAFNETQQSLRDEFVSPTQVSRNVLIKSMMNYQNSNVGYQRLGNEGLLEIMRAKHVYEQDIKNGVSEGEAKKKVAGSVIRGTRKMMIAFTILPGLWYLGGRGIVGITAPLISSLFGGGDDDEPYLDDEAKEDLMLSMALGTVAGTTGGQAIASVVQGREYEPMAYVKEFSKIITDAVKDGFNLNTTKNIALKMAKFGGVNVETFENIYLGVEHAIRTGNFDLVDFMFLINLPPSQRKKMAEELYSDMPFMEYAKKVARAQKLFDDYRKNLPYAKKDKNGSKKNAIKKQYVIENLSDDKQDKLEKEKEFKKLQREYGYAEDKDEWLEDHPEYNELETSFKRQEVTKEVNRKAKELK